MKAFFVFASLLLFMPTAHAQIFEGQEGEVISQPICTFLTNRSEQTILGTISTLSRTNANGDVSRFRDNFRLEAGKRLQFCAAGPFFAGRRVELVLRTLLPLFSCKTAIDREIFLDAKEDASSIRKLSATCY